MHDHLTKAATEAVERVRSSLCEELRMRKEDLLVALAGRLLHAFSTGTVFEIRHDSDPPWDHSGRAVDTGRPYRSSDFDTVGDFLEAYCGESRPTFESGFGLCHECWSDRAEDWATDLVRDVFRDVLDWIDAEDEGAIRHELHEPRHPEEDLMQVLGFADLLTEDLCEAEVGLLCEIADRPFERMRTVGAEGAAVHAALNEARKEEAIRRATLEERRIDRFLTYVWPRLVALYRCRYHSDMPRRVEKPSFGPLRKLLVASDLPESDFRLVPEVVSVSNSVRGELVTLRRSAGGTRGHKGHLCPGDRLRTNVAVKATFVQAERGPATSADSAVVPSPPAPPPRLLSFLCLGRIVEQAKSIRAQARTHATPIPHRRGRPALRSFALLGHATP
jgi:hypothetical protein